jgi:hypothetical protein
VWASGTPWKNSPLLRQQHLILPGIYVVKIEIAWLAALQKNIGPEEILSHGQKVVNCLPRKACANIPR